MNNPNEVQSLLPQADFLVGGRLNGEQLSLLKRCKLIQSQGVGYDSVDVDALTAAGIPFALTPEGTVIGVAEHTILLILALYKQLVQVRLSMQAGKFQILSGDPTHTSFTKRP